ncbi:MAG: hypothetical protein IJW86_10525 [Clostridia bacterium]|nr:hypothetical protein [Clostridia bacterium]
MEYKKIGQIAAIAVVAVWVFCISFAVSMKIAKKDDPVTTLPPPQLQTTTAPGNQQAGVTFQQSGDVTLNSGGNAVPSQNTVTPSQQGTAAPTQPQADQQQPTANQGTAATLKVPQSKAEIIKAYVDGVNALKTQSNFALYKDDKLNITIDSITGGSMVQSFAESMLSNSQKQPTSYNFQNGYDAPTGATPASTIAPLGQLASIDESFVTNATATANADGGFTVNLAFADESQSYPNETVHHKNVVEVVDVAGLVPSGATVNYMDMVYSGTTVSATFDSSGRINHMRHYLNVSQCQGSGSMSVFTMNITLHGDFVSEYTITY